STPEGPDAPARSLSETDWGEGDRSHVSHERPPRDYMFTYRTTARWGPLELGSALNQSECEISHRDDEQEGEVGKNDSPDPLDKKSDDQESDRYDQHVVIQPHRACL